MSNQQPQPYDAVLGGQTQVPFDAAVLGGIQGVRQKLASDNEDAKKEGILQALNYGEKGIEALFGVLEQERNINIQWLAHQTLAKQGDPVIEARLKNYFPWYEYESVTVNCRGEIIQRTPGRAKYYREDLGNGVYLDMVYIPGGSFLMGAPESEHGSNDSERPQHWATVPDFWMGKHQITQAQWQAIMGENPALFEEANLPITCVSWLECQEFCQKLLELRGKQYRLPSETEWEYACRAGTQTPFNCGETLTNQWANIAHFDYQDLRVAVGLFPPNTWGLYDMHGNIWEWCEDDWHDDYQEVPINNDPWRADYEYMSHLNKKVIRGGSYYVPCYHCRSACRNKIRGMNINDDNYDGYIDIGLRLAIGLDKN